jgi:hypothetical protein
MDQETTLILGAAIALVTSILTTVMTGLVNYFVARSQAKHDLETRRKTENAQIRWDEIKRDIEAAEQLVEAINLRATQMHNWVKVLQEIERCKKSNEPTLELERRADFLKERLLTDDNQLQSIYAHAVWRINSLPKDVRDTYEAFDQVVSKNTMAGEDNRLTVNLTEINLAGGKLRTILRDYLTIAREEVTSS